MLTLYKLLDNSIYIITISYILYYTTKYYTEKVGTCDTEFVSYALQTKMLNKRLYGKK